MVSVTTIARLLRVRILHIHATFSKFGRVIELVIVKKFRNTAILIYYLSYLFLAQFKMAAE